MLRKDDEVKEIPSEVVAKQVTKILPPFALGFLQAPLQAAMEKSLAIRDNHEALHQSWCRLIQKIEEHHLSKHFDQLMAKYKARSLGRVIEHLFLGQHFYHNEKHAAEMGADVPQIVRPKGEDVEDLLSARLGEKNGLDHDVIQGEPKQIDNEINSALLNAADFIEIAAELDAAIKAKQSKDGLGLKEKELRDLAEALSWTIVDHTFLILGGLSLASERFKLEKALYAAKPDYFQKRNADLHFLDRIGIALEFSDVLRASAAGIVHHPAYLVEFGNTQSALEVDSQAAVRRILASQVKILQTPGIGAAQFGPAASNLLFGQMLRMLCEMHNKFRFTPSGGLSPGALNDLSQRIQAQVQPQGTADALIAELKAATPDRPASVVLRERCAAFPALAYAYTTPADQRAIKRMLHCLQMYHLTRDEAYKLKYQELLDAHGPELLRVFIYSALNPQGSADLDFAFNRNIFELMDRAEELQVPLRGDIDPLAWYKQALLVDKKLSGPKLDAVLQQWEKRLQELRDLEKTKPENGPLDSQIKKIKGRIEKLRALKSQAQAKNFKDLVAFFQRFQGHPALEKALFNHFMMHAALQQGMHFEFQAVRQQAQSFKGVARQLNLYETRMRGQAKEKTTVQVEAMESSRRQMLTLVAQAEATEEKQVSWPQPTFFGRKGLLPPITKPMNRQEPPSGLCVVGQAVQTTKIRPTPPRYPRTKAPALSQAITPVEVELVPIRVRWLSQPQSPSLLVSGRKITREKQLSQKTQTRTVEGSQSTEGTKASHLHKRF